MADGLYKHILVPTDFRPDSREAYRVAVATALGTGARVSLLHVVPAVTPEEYGGMDAFRLLYEGRSLRPKTGLDPEQVQTHAARLREDFRRAYPGAVEPQAEVRCGDPVTEIARYAHENDVDLIVTTGARPSILPDLGRSLTRRLARATRTKVLHITPPAAG